MHIDVFNGDGDGIFSLIQLRKAIPVEQQTLVTGVKRDNALVKQISDADAKDAVISILDISFDKNTAELLRVLQVAELVLYIDHHQAETEFKALNLTTNINHAATVCTGLLVREHLHASGVANKDSANAAWAVAAAFGDGLDNVAHAEGTQLGYSTEQLAQLKELGVLVNYNGYGAAVPDLHFPPADLYRQLFAYDSPFAVIADDNSPFSTLKTGYEADLTKARECTPLADDETLIAVMLDNAPWARRISGTLGNLMAAENQHKAIVIASQNKANADEEATLTISLRAPKNNLQGAGDICASFPTGGGRAGAAGVNALPVSGLLDFLRAVRKFYRVKSG
ncbi:MAG: DHH family phosphoesterase [Idiomarina sp.]|nr:DHH family phosphoesterase [Idiomarina sp.]